MSAQKTVFVDAHAKINLTLDVLGKRDDGYHALASVMQTIALHDTLKLTTDVGGVVRVACDDPELQGEDNLALRAARLFKAEVGDDRLGATIELRKEVPVQAGLGGGSSDAAAVLNALNLQWGAGFPADKLVEIAAQLGSDVPFFIRGGSALMEGRGELVTPLPDAEPLWILLTKPHVGLSTASVFRQLTPAGYSDGAATNLVVESVRAGQRLALQELFNALEPGVMSWFPEVRAVRETLLDAGAPIVHMSGSGPTVFAPFRSLSHALEVFTAMRHTPYDVWLTHTVTSSQMPGVLPNR